MSAPDLKSKQETIKLCDLEIKREYEYLAADPKPDLEWYWDRIDRWLDIRICLMRKIGQG